MDVWICLLIIFFASVSVDASRRRRYRRSRSRSYRSRSRRSRFRPKYKNTQKIKTGVRGNNNVVHSENIKSTGIHGSRIYNKARGRTILVQKVKLKVTGYNNVVSGTNIHCRRKREVTEKIRCDFDIHDLNMDGVIPYDEFIYASSYLNQFDKSELFKLFDNIDGNGLITKTEFRIGAQMLTNLGHMEHCNFLALAGGPCFA